MSFESEYEKLRKKRLKEAEERQQSTSKKSFAEQYDEAKSHRLATEKENANTVAFPTYMDLKQRQKESDTPLPLLPTLLRGNMSAGELHRDKEEWKANAKKFVTPEESTVFQSGAFDDGYQFGDVFKSVIATAGDTILSGAQGFGNFFEGIFDLAAYGTGEVADWLGMEDVAEQQRKAAEYEGINTLFDFLRDQNKKLNAQGYAISLEDNTLLGDKGRGFAETLGGVGGMLATAGLGGAVGLSAKGASYLGTASTFASSTGSGIDEAYKAGATDEDAWKYGATKGVIDAGTELMFGGLGKGFGALGIGKSAIPIDDILAKKLTKNISNVLAKNSIQLGVKGAAEGVEELAAGYLTAHAQKGTFKSEEDFDKLIEDQDLLEQFVMGALAGGMVSSVNLPSSVKSGRDYITGLTANEQTVVDKEIANRIADAEKDGKTLTKKDKSKIESEVLEDLKKGYISTDTIESALGGDTYKSYQDTVTNEEPILKEYEELGKKQNATLAEYARYTELQGTVKNINSKKTQLQAQLSEEVQKSLVRDNNGKVQTDDFLLESYNERARRGQTFEADVSKYDAKQQATIQKAIDSGILNNTRRTHDFVDMVAKISADKGVLFDFANNEKIKESGFAKDGKFVNGYVTKDGVTLNINSSKSLNSVVGHEITHVLEGTELYTELQNAIKDYAVSKKDYKKRLDTLKKLYKGVEGADIDAELTADLVGDYLFTDSDFISHLSTKNRNVFQKIYDEIKYLCKIATAGSKEARQLEKVKKAFDKAYRESSKATGDTDGSAASETQYSVSVTDKKTIDFLDNQEHIVTYKSMQVIDGKLYPPMAAKVKGADGKYHLNTPSQLGVWQQATEDPSNIKKIKNGIGYYTLNKGDGTSIDAAYNPYEHSSNLVLNDQFESAHRRNNLVTVECIIPVSEMSSGYRAQYAKDSTGVMDWKAGVVAGQIKDNKRKVYLSRYLKPVRILSDAETAQKYKDILDGTGVSVPFNVVSPSLLTELEKVGVDIDYDGSPMYQSNQKRKAEKEAAKNSTKYSLSAEQQEYFKDSKVRDENGNLKVMYHGTSKGGHTVFDTYGSNYGLFGQGSYFTDNKSVAESYTNKGKGNNKQVYESYLNITNPIDMDAQADADAWKKALPEADFPESGTNEQFYRAMEEHLADEEYPKWEAAEIAMDVIQSMGYDGITHIGGGRVNADGTRHQVYIAFEPEQIKNVDNLKPTSDPDIRFSLSETVEETKDLMALHNLQSSELLKSLDLGGLPMPSIAVIKAKDSHEQYGDVSLILPKETIDPKRNKANKVYGGDAWTPTYPKIEYKPRESVAKKISDKYYELASKVGYDDVRPLYRYVSELEDVLNRSGGEAGMLEELYNDTRVMQLYLADTGKGKVETIQKEIRTELSETEVERNEYFINALGGDVVDAVMAKEGQKIPVHRREYWEKHGEKIKETYRKLMTEEYGFSDDLVQNVFSNMKTFDFLKLIIDAHRYRTNGRVTTKTEADIAATDEAIKKAAADGYKEWVDGLFKGVEEKSGIRNNAEYFTRTGNRRSWDALHWANTLENVVKTMKGQEETGVGSLSPYNTFASLAHKRYGSIEEVKADSDRLGKVSEAEYEAMGDAFANRFSQIANSIKDTSERNQFIALDEAAELIVDAVRSYKTKSGMLGYLQKWNKRATAQTVDDVVSLVNDIANMPTGYFEAKPLRAVGFDEVGVFVIPRNADVKLKQELLNRGYSIAEYDPDVEGDRQKVVNSFEEYKFSLSNIGETPKTYGNFNFYGKDMMLAPTDIAPVQEEVAADDIAPTAAYEAIKPKPEKPIVTAKSRNGTKLESVQTELTNNKTLREESLADFNQEIARLQDEYDSKKNKNTKYANNLLRRIERTKRLRDSVDADYAKRISNLETKEKLMREGKPTARQELHQNLVDGLKTKFTEKGYDFDKVLKGAKNLSTFSTVDNTPQRVMEKALGYKEGQILADETVNKVAQNETEGIKWLNSFTNRKDGILAKLSKQYDIKPGSKESAAAQMYAEGFYVNENDELVTYGDAELKADFPNERVRNNIKNLATDPRIRSIYDETLARINESRTRNAYPEIPRLDNYFLHFRAMEDTFSRLGLPFNPNDIRAKDLPTDLNGVTADLKPGQPYFASAMHRKGNRTSFDLLGGLERYLTSAKNQIYHIDDIQTLRALRNYIADNYGQAKGLESLDTLTEEEAQERIKQVYNSHLSTFAKFLNEEANILAGKTSLIDRGLEGIIGRRGITFLDTVNKQVGSNMVGFNLSSALTNFISGVQAIAKTNKLACVKSLAQTTASKVGSLFGKTDSFVENNPTIIRRKGADRFHRTPFQKIGDAGYVLMGAVDNVTTEFIVRAKYNEFIQKGMSEQQAIVEADKWTSRLMGDRSLGQMPQLYNSKMLGLVTKFQLEVRNQLDSQFYDTIQETKASNEDIKNGLERNAKTAAKVTATFFELAVLQHLFGVAFESIAGYNPTFDIIEVLAKTFGLDDDEEDEDTVLDNVEEGFLTLLEDLPYTSTFTGGRIPISSALPIEELIKGEDEYGNEKSRLETLGEIAPYYLLPGGYGQIKKTAQGLSMFDEDLPTAGSYTDSGNLRFPIDDTFANRVQAGLFGQWASENARDYFDNERKPLNEKQTQEFIDVDMPIKDYWEYREGLSGLKTIGEKADYINELDLPISKKNLLLNNIADRKESLDMSDYDNYDNFEEFDFAQKNPEKYSFFKDNGISYKDYATADEDGKEAYTWAYNNPEKFILSKAVASDVVEYRKYTGELYDIKADKDENGNSISGSRKKKVAEYINNLDADYGEKIILFKSEYNADDTYNYEIIDYLNSREDISYEEMETILKELGFTVKADGTIEW